jgi:hypothetical protein
MPELQDAALARGDRRRVNAFADKAQRALAGVDLMLDGLTEREKLLVLHIALDRQLKLDQAQRQP